MRVIFTVSFISIFLTVVSCAVSAESIKPFTSDGCSLFPDGTIKQNELWLSCCTAHDYAYWQGGTLEQKIIADNQLHQCVEQLGETEIASIMLTGVTVGGNPYLPTPFRWGYGWSYPRMYQALTDVEKDQIINIEKVNKAD